MRSKPKEVPIARAGSVKGRRRLNAGGTRDKILDAAEMEFSSRGFEGCSLRTIANANGINLGLIYYYFEGKESLFSEAYLRRAKGMVSRRKAMLRAAKLRHGSRPVPVGEIIRCFLVPLVEMTKMGPGPRAWIRLQGLLRSQPSEFSRKLRGKALNSSNKMFIKEFQRSCPELDRATVVWRFTAMISGFYALISNSTRVAELYDGLCDSDDVDVAFAQAVPFFISGFAAPLPDADLIVPLSTPAMPLRYGRRTAKHRDPSRAKRL